MRTLALVAAALALCTVVLPPPAQADGDPASHVLLVQDTFTPYPAPDPAADAALRKSVEHVFARRLRIKVAVVASRVDLGSVPSFFNKPGLYAKLLGIEIGSLYVGPLLIVMPKGFGIYDGGRPTAAAARVLAELKPGGRSATALVGSARTAVDKLLAARALGSRDILPPFVYPRVPFVKPGDTASLSFIISEDSEWARDTVTVYSGEQQLAVFESPMQRAVYATPHAVQWHVPDPAPPELRYCVRATDLAGNKGKEYCLPIKVQT